MVSRFLLTSLKYEKGICYVYKNTNMRKQAVGSHVDMYYNYYITL